MDHKHLFWTYPWHGLVFCTDTYTYPYFGPSNPQKMMFFRKWCCDVLWHSSFDSILMGTLINLGLSENMLPPNSLVHQCWSSVSLWQVHYFRRFWRVFFTSFKQIGFTTSRGSRLDRHCSVPPWHLGAPQAPSGFFWSVAQLANGILMLKSSSASEIPYPILTPMVNTQKHRKTCVNPEGQSACAD